MSTELRETLQTREALATAATRAERTSPKPTYMGVIEVDPVEAYDRDTQGRRICAIARRLPFTFANGEPYTTLLVLVPVALNGSAQAFAEDHRKVTAKYTLDQIPSTDKNPYRMSVVFSPSAFTDRDNLVLPDALPVIVR